MKRPFLLLIIEISFFIFPSRLKSQTTNSPNQNNFEIRQSGFTSINEIGTSIPGFSDLSNYNNRNPPFIFRTINGYLINPNLSLALGIEFYNSDAFSLIPIFIDFRYTFLKSIASPLIYFDGGYSSASSKSNGSGDNYSGGSYLAVGFGLKIFLSKFIYLTADICIFNQNITNNYFHHGPYNNNFDINDYLIKIGIGF